MDIAVREIEPTRFEAAITTDGARRTCVVVVPAGVGVPGVTDEDLVETVVAVLLESGAHIPTSMDVTSMIRARPDVWAEVEARLD